MLEPLRPDSRRSAAAFTISEASRVSIRLKAISSFVLLTREATS
ncbi:hypothetical protein AVEN_99228-1, partial [Araneus ventricosus]